MKAPAIESYATLVGKKLLLPSPKTKYVAVDRAFLIDVLKCRVERIHVDEKWYLNCNPDVCDAVLTGLVKDAREHYVSRGYFENRMPYPIAVEEAWYLDRYEDIRVAVQGSVFPSGQAHFEAVGYGEGRLPYAAFQLANALRSA